MKRNHLYLVILVCIGLINSSCRKVIDIELKEANPRLVVESIISDKNVPFEVKLSTTQNYFSQSEPPAVTSALVIISDDMGNIDTLLHTINGIYKTPISKQGVEDRTYRLYIKNKNKEYTAFAKLNGQLPMDSISYTYLNKSFGFLEPGYYINLHTFERPKEGDFYRWLLFRNDTLLIDPFKYMYADDKLVNGNKIDLQFPFRYNPNDSVRIVQWAINKEYFDYLTDLDTQLGRSGSPFDAPPANPRTNLSNGALGYFAAVASQEKSLRIEP